MLVDGGERRQIETAADFLEARRVAVLLDELVEVIQDFALTFGERKHGNPPVDLRGDAAERSIRPRWRTICEHKAKIKRESVLHS